MKKTVFFLRRIALLCALSCLVCLTAPAEEMPAVADEPLVLTERFEELFQKNGDIIGWIEAGTQISEVVTFREHDNEYYLHRDLYGNYSENGTVYADERYMDWKSDPYILLYGHNMRSGAMFGCLDNYLNGDYLKENARVRVYLPYSETPLEYVPFAALDMCAIPNAYGYFPLRCFEEFRIPKDEAAKGKRDEKVAELLNTIRTRAKWSLSEIDVTPDDRVIGLVTCSYHYESGRLILFCRALRPEETPEEMQELVRKSVEEW